MAIVPTATEQGCSHFRVEDFKGLWQTFTHLYLRKNVPGKHPEKEAFQTVSNGY